MFARRLKEGLVGGWTQLASLILSCSCFTSIILCPPPLTCAKSTSKYDLAVPDPRSEGPVRDEDKPGTVCFICSERVQYMGSLGRHAARCFMKADALEVRRR